MNARAILWLPLAGALAAAGCATAPEGPMDADRAEPAATTVEEDGTVRHSVPNRAVALLWDRAERARKDGRIEDALGSLERALRLSPDDPVLWSRVAELRLRQGEYAVAENLAAKSNALAGEQRLLRYRNWLLIAEARERRGDPEGAEQARAEAEQYGGP
ncbi:MAG: hypothetical protein R3225_06340 [Halofilum sp. (in: g-proteobacteria)]|nr:hypothetical protein [Halofilum sp. (in: g-proteobacteria)]